MYWLSWVSKDEVLETYARKGLYSVSIEERHQYKLSLAKTYYNEVREESVEKEDLLNAGH